MKTNLTVEQSAELIRLGINPERASIQMPVDAPYRTSGIRLAPVQLQANRDSAADER